MLCTWDAVIIAWWTPMQGLQAHRWYVKTCEMAANSAKEPFGLSSQQLSSSSKRTISLASLICVECGLRDKRTIGKPKSVLYIRCNGQKGQDRYLYVWNLSTRLREASYWPKNGLRSNLITSEFIKLFCWTIPRYIIHTQPTLAVAYLHTYYGPAM